MIEGLDLAALLAEARAAIASATTTEELRSVAAAVSGKKSPLASAGRVLGGLDAGTRRELGRQLHETRTVIEDLLEERRQDIRAAELARELDASRVDLTEFIPGSSRRRPRGGASTW